MDAATIVAIISVAIAFFTAVNSASRAELNELRVEVRKLRRENRHLERYVDELCRVLREHNIPIPPFPADVEGDDD